MENLTHSLLGASLAEVALPGDATRAQRQLFFVGGVLAANLPDADLLYTRIAAPPLGYLLHHRGHTHTIVGCAILGALMWVVTRAVPSLRRTVAESPKRFWALIAMALASHLLADSWNSYGVHPFWPVDNRWFYGDSIFIAEPWLWVTLGVACVLNTRSKSGQRVFAGVMISVPIAAAAIHWIPVGSFAALLVGAVLLAACTFRVSAQRRSAVGLSAAGAFVVGMFALHGIARGAALESLRSSQRGEIVDVVLSPRAAQPFCWTAMPVEKIESADEYIVRRGEIGIFPSLIGGCVAPSATTPKVLAAWTSEEHESLSRLRERARDDCYVRAWLQFGRVPESPIPLSPTCAMAMREVEASRK